MPHQQPMNAKQWMGVLFLAALWGSSYFFIALGVRDLPPFTLVAIRLGLAAAILGAVASATGKRFPTDRKVLRELVLLGLFNNFLAFSLISWAEKNLESSLASIIVATSPVFTLLFIHYTPRLAGPDYVERIGRSRFVGAAVGLAGIVVLFAPKVRELGSFLAQTAVLVAAMAYGGTAVFGRRFHRLPAIITATGMLGSGALMALVASLIFENPWRLSVGFVSFGAVAVLAVFNTAVAFLVYYKLLAVVGPAKLSVISFIAPVSSIFLGVFILGERITPVMWFGVVMILIALVLLDQRVLRRLANRLER